jgi:hypothetical protein
LEPFVFERELRGGAGRREQAAPLEQHRVVNERGDRSVGRAEHGHRPVGPRTRQLDRPALAVDVRPSLRQPERELERRVAESAR